MGIGFGGFGVIGSGKMYILVSFVPRLCRNLSSVYQSLLISKVRACEPNVKTEETSPQNTGRPSIG